MKRNNMKVGLKVALKAGKERDELRARLAEIEAQEPVPNDDIRFLDCPLYARPVPAIPAGWKLAPVEPTQQQWNAGARAAREYLEETGGNSPAVIYRAMINAAPEHKA